VTGAKIARDGDTIMKLRTNDSAYTDHSVPVPSWTVHDIATVARQPVFLSSAACQDDHAHHSGSQARVFTGWHLALCKSPAPQKGLALLRSVIAATAMSMIDRSWTNLQLLLNSQKRSVLALSTHVTLAQNIQKFANS